MMRKIFGGTMVLSIVGAVVLGGILAFQSQQTTNEFSASVGDAQWALAYQAEPNTIVPGYGLEVVGEGYLANDPGSSFAIVNNGGFVTLSESTSGCPTSLFGSAVRVIQTAPVNPGDGFAPDSPVGAINDIPGSLVSTNDWPGGSPPPGWDGPSDATWGTYPGAFQALLSIGAAAPGPCFGATVAYHVTINVTPQPIDVQNGTGGDEPNNTVPGTEG